MKSNRCLKIFFTGIALLLVPSFAAGATYHVNGATGSDAASNNCSDSGAPCKTITHAVSVVPEGAPTNLSIIEVAGSVGPAITYDESGNGEIFPINITRDFIVLQGGGIGESIIDADITGNIGLNVSGNGVKITGFTFANTSTGIGFTEGGFVVQDNLFAASVETGIYGSISSDDASSSISVAGFEFLNNQFACSNYGVDFRVQLDFNVSTTGLTAQIGEITATGNTFLGTDTGFSFDAISVSGLKQGVATVGNINVSNNTCTNCSTGILLKDLYAQDFIEGTVNWGTINIDDNTFTNNSDAIVFNGFFGHDSADMFSTILELKDMSISGNTITDNSTYGINVDYFDVNNIYGASQIVLGNLTIDDNTIEPDSSSAMGSGIYLYDVGSISYIFGSSTVTTGTISVSNNTVEVNDYALYFYNYGIWSIGNEDATDTVDVDFGVTNISGNTLASSSSYGLYIDHAYFGYDQFGLTDVDVGLFTIHDNEITSTGNDALFMYYSYESGYNLGDNAKLTIDGLTITDNTIDTDGGIGCYLYLYEVGYNLDNFASMSVGPTSISGNTITSSAEGLYLYFYYVAYEMYNRSVFTMAPWTINNNTINASSEGIYLYYYDYYVASYMNDNSRATLPEWNITNNTIDVEGSNDGFYFYSYSSPDDNEENAAVYFGSMTIDNNIFNPDKDSGMDNGIYFYLEDVCEDCDDSSTFTQGEIKISNNQIYNGNYGIYMEIDDFGYSFDNNGKASLGNISFMSNTIDDVFNGFYLSLDLDTEAFATVRTGGVSISDNTLTNIKDEGIYFNLYTSIAAPTSLLSLGETKISGNAVTAASSGLQTDSRGIRVDESTAKGIYIGKQEVISNTVSGFHKGVQVEGNESVALRCNTVQNNSVAGFYFQTDNSMSASFNSITGNGLGMQIPASSSTGVDAINNWWGSTQGPVACSSCNKIDEGGGSIVYSPWLSEVPAPTEEQCNGSVFSWHMFLPALMSGATQK